MTRCRRCDWRSIDVANDELLTPDGTERTPDELLTQHAQWSGHMLCTSCYRSLEHGEVQTCSRCIARAREHLAGIVLMRDELIMLLGRTSSRGGKGNGDTPLTGGTILVLLGPGGTGTAEDATTSLKGDPFPIAWFLAQTEDDWRHTFGHEAASGYGSSNKVFNAALDYVQKHLELAAREHYGWDQWARELRELHGHCEAATGRVRREIRSDAPCLSCDGPVVRQITDGLEDPGLTCKQCGRYYPDHDGESLLLHKQAAERASRYLLDDVLMVTPAVAAAIGRSERTIRNWARLEMVRSEKRSGVLFVAMADVQREHDNRGTRRRAA